jgi:phosphoglucomutase
MTRLREAPPSELNGVKVIEIRDYKTEKIKDLAADTERETGLPVSNVLYFVLEDESWLCIRPSGTEPKIKVYFGVNAESLQKADARLEALSKAAMKEIL